MRDQPLLADSAKRIDVVTAMVGADVSIGGPVGPPPCRIGARQLNLRSRQVMADERRATALRSNTRNRKPAREPAPDGVAALVAEGIRLGDTFRLENRILGEDRDEIIHTQPITVHGV